MEATTDLLPACRICRIRRLGRADYASTRTAMRTYTESRDETTPDELWLLEHPPVYTYGQGADTSHGPRFDNGIALVKAERGGDITYHGPGQLVLYTLVDLARRRIGVKRYVQLMEQSVIDFLAERGISGVRRPGAPGVYVDDAKIAALGIRVSRGRAYHGLALNVDMDLTPFLAIDPCGYTGLRVTQLREHGVSITPEAAGERLADILMEHLEHG